MNVLNTISDIRSALDNPRRQGKTIGLVPTMGALHEGHISLISEARATCDFVVVSIFVNPTQFGPNEDLDRYPRTPETDLEACRNAGVDYVFHPSANEMYPNPDFVRFNIVEMADHLCGFTRPGHFNGVLQVVNKFLQIVQPTDAWFGQKDIQQFILIETMAREFNIPVRIHRGETIRESDGLALSSRNRYLSESERGVAGSLYATLQFVSGTIWSSGAVGGGDHWTGEGRPDNKAVLPEEREESILADEQVLMRVIAEGKAMLTASGFKIDYLSVVDYSTLQPQNRIVSGRKYIVAAAGWLGKTRLIDNIIV
ncbi:MAG: pantoate--beta-alanine ligase [Balneolales bacterium]|nr:pantoate--beta-alanine ligase [Balneolales bacterium]